MKNFGSTRLDGRQGLPGGRLRSQFYTPTREHFVNGCVEMTGLFAPPEQQRKVLDADNAEGQHSSGVYGKAKAHQQAERCDLNQRAIGARKIAVEPLPQGPHRNAHDRAGDENARQVALDPVIGMVVPAQPQLAPQLADIQQAASVVAMAMPTWGRYPIYLSRKNRPMEPAALTARLTSAKFIGVLVSSRAK